MKTLLITLALAAPMVAVRYGPCLVAEGCAPFLQDARDGEDDQEHVESPLEQEMEIVEENLGVVRRAIRDAATYPAALEAIERIEASTLRAKLLAPPMAAGLPEAERADFLRDYRLMLIDMVAAELALERALLEGDADAIKAAFKALRDFEDAGHERFTEDE